MVNKAHTATIRRIAKRYSGVIQEQAEIDIVCDGMVIEVETTATIGDGLARLEGHVGLRYVAVTNKEAVNEAIRLTAGTGIGVMDPNGNIVRESTNHQR